MMKRWLVLLVIGAVVMTGLQGCVLVVADEDAAHEIREHRDRSRVARDIQRDIDEDEMLDYSDISISEHDGIVTLAGDAESLSALKRAIDIALSHPDTEELRLHIDVRPDE